MRNNFNLEIVSQIRTHLPKDLSVVTFLMDLLYLGKESVYRRIRGDIPFTLDEFVTISSKLGLSIDRIVGLKDVNHSSFSFMTSNMIYGVEDYLHKLECIFSVFNESNSAKNVKVNGLLAHFPHWLSIHFDCISKFRYYKWMYQNQVIDRQCLFSSVELPSKINEWKSAMVNMRPESASYNYIFDDNVFLSIIRDIDFFYKLGLIDISDLEVLKLEMMEIMGILEKMTKTGEAFGGRDFSLYISNMNAGVSYMYMEADNIVRSYMLPYDVDLLVTYNLAVAEMNRNWIEQYKRYSTLITRSGEMERAEFLKLQRNRITLIGNTESLIL